MIKKIATTVVMLSVLAAGAVAADSYAVDVKASKVKWEGRKVTGAHDGTINVKEGTLTVAGSQITGGNVQIDMNSITVLDIKDAKSNANLTNHLKSDDFFGVATFPTATFQITETTPLLEATDKGDNMLVVGQLTIKGITHPLSFPAKVSLAKGTLKASAAGVKVDRALYDVRYGSGKFFENLGDKLIYDEFTLNIDLSAKASKK